MCVLGGALLRRYALQHFIQRLFRKGMLLHEHEGMSLQHMQPTGTGGPWRSGHRPAQHILEDAMTSACHGRPNNLAMHLEILERTHHASFASMRAYRLCNLCICAV